MVYVHQDHSRYQVKLQVERVGYLDKLVRLGYQTQEVDPRQEVYMAGVRVYNALEGADFIRAEGMFTFYPGEVSFV